MEKLQLFDCKKNPSTFLRANVPITRTKVTGWPKWWNGEVISNSVNQYLFIYLFITQETFNMHYLSTMKPMFSYLRAL